MADEKNTAPNGLQKPSQVIENNFYRLSEKDGFLAAAPSRRGDMRNQRVAILENIS